LSERSANGVVQRGDDVSRTTHANGSGPGRRRTAFGRVLLLDTDVPFRQTLVDALDRFGIEVSWRARVLGLFDALAEADPIVLIMAADLPGSDPLELIRSVRRSRWAELPILVITSEPDRSFELRAYVDGADTVVSRAGTAGELAAHIMGHAARRRRRRQDTARDLADVALALSERDTARAGYRPEPAPPSNGYVADAPEAVAQPAPPLPSHENEASAQEPVASGPGLGERHAPDATPLAQLLYDPTADSGFQAAAKLSSGVAAPGDVPVAPDSVGGTRSTAAPLQHPHAAVPDVILVDDDPSLLEMLRYALTNRGYKTLSLSNGLDALRTLRELQTGDRRPVVLLDVDLPGLDGFRILHELGGCRPGDFQVILCTVHSSEATQVLGIQSGAVDYIVKPFRMPIVLAKVERLLGSPRLPAGA
jgi:DNA-binding response OmpR family regulator